MLPIKNIDKSVLLSILSTDFLDLHQKMIFPELVTSWYCRTVLLTVTGTSRSLSFVGVNNSEQDCTPKEA